MVGGGLGNHLASQMYVFLSKQLKINNRLITQLKQGVFKVSRCEIVDSGDWFNWACFQYTSMRLGDGTRSRQ